MFIYSTAPLFGFNIAEQELMLPGTVLIWLIKVAGVESKPSCLVGSRSASTPSFRIKNS